MKYVVSVLVGTVLAAFLGIFYIGNKNAAKADEFFKNQENLFAKFDTNPLPESMGIPEPESIAGKLFKKYPESETLKGLTYVSAPEDLPVSGTNNDLAKLYICLLYTSPSPRDATLARMPSSA